MPSLASSVASEPPTLSPLVISATSDTISTVPRLILVGMFSACAACGVPVSPPHAKFHAQTGRRRDV